MLIDERTFYSNRGGTYLFPFYLYRDTKLQSSAFETEIQRPILNLNRSYIERLERILGLTLINDFGDFSKTVGANDVIHYIYAVFHSPSYRSRYDEFLRIGFPRLSFTRDRDLFRSLCQKGADLVAVHLLKDNYPNASWNILKPKGQSPLQCPLTKFSGRDSSEVINGYPDYKNSSVFINPSQWFEGIPENVWNFHIGGYQVCEKWLKDRRGRVLSDEDIIHYQRIVVALNETIHLMKEIDKVIEEHGGWPDAFVTETSKS